MKFDKSCIGLLGSTLIDSFFVLNTSLGKGGKEVISLGLVNLSLRTDYVNIFGFVGNYKVDLFSFSCWVFGVGEILTFPLKLKLYVINSYLINYNTAGL